MAEGAEHRDPADVIDAIVGDIKEKLRGRAAEGHLAQGAGQGAGVTDAKLTLWKRRKPRPAEANALRQAATASAWTRARCCQALGQERAGDGRCPSVAGDFRRIWGRCPRRPARVDFDRTDGVD